MIIWFIDSIFGGVSPVGEFDLFVGFLGAFILAFLGVFLVTLWSNDKHPNQETIRMIKQGFRLLKFAVLFLLFGNIAFSAVIFYAIYKIGEMMIKGYYIAYDEKQKNEN